MNCSALRAFLVVFSFLFIGCSANKTSPVSVDVVKRAFQQHFPDQTVLGVSQTPLPGIYEVVVKGRKIVYVDQTAEYLILGNLIDIKNKVNLTEKKEKELAHVDWKTLPLEWAIKEVRGNGKRQLAVFTDPDCPYCKRLERDSLSGLTDITIYTFLYPLNQLHPDALHKSKQIWCAKDRLAAWAAFMRDDKSLTGPANCKNPLEKIQKLGSELGIIATPALIFSNGDIETGAWPRNLLEERLQK